MNKLVYTLLLLVLNFGVKAEVVRVAVASNFTAAIHAIAKEFQQQTGHELLISSASTGKLFAQIKNGAPFDVFMSADTATAEKLIAEGLAVKDSLHAYALGQLVLLSNHKTEQSCEAILFAENLRHLAIANPKTAPYGLAAQQVLTHLGRWDNIQPNLVMGENIAQTMQFTVSQNADAGLVALALLQKYELTKQQCTWQVPTSMYHPIKQSMVIIERAKNHPAVLDFYAFMSSNETKNAIKSFGYAEPQ